MLAADVSSQYLNPARLKIRIRNRQTKKVWDSRFVNLSQYGESNKADISISAVDFAKSTMSAEQLDASRYSAIAYDFFFYCEFDQVQCKQAWMRIIDKHSDDTIVPFGESNQLVVHEYETVKAGYSWMTTVIPREMLTSLTNLKSQNDGVTDKPIVLISEYPTKAQDNGFHLFKYMMEHCLDEYQPYYLIERSSPDVTNLLPFMDNVVFFHTAKHYELYMHATYLCHTHTSKYAMPLYTKQTLQRRAELKKVFLQHGITAGKDVSGTYSKAQDPQLTDKFIVCSHREKKLVHDELGFANDDIKITGFARFDYLLEHRGLISRIKAGGSILVMPTWRKGMIWMSDDQFMHSDYYLELTQLLKSLRENKRNRTISLYLHHNFQKFSHLFNVAGVEVLTENKVNVQRLFVEHSVLITDFSSVGLDFALLNRPVVYYHFATDDEIRSTALEMLPGPVFAEENDVIEYVNGLSRIPKLDKVYHETLVKNIYEYNDSGACARIVKVLDEF